MREGLKEAWISDLEDEANQDKQGTGCLADGTGQYCCLGRLMVVAKEKFGLDIEVLDRLTTYGEGDEPGVDERRTEDGVVFAYGDTHDWEVLPKDFAAWAGLDPNPEVYVPDDEMNVKLSDLNDGGSSFMEIANLIKESDL